ncbi:MAG: ATP-binding cassette domain-containing protein, partial [bacterium]|nr:ATP-binding cassette domain-containing protein [bacterium]
IAGVDGNGQQELAEVLTGLRTPTSGRLGYSGDWFTVMSPLDFYRLGGSAIPADRHHTGLALELSVRDNLVMKELVLGRLQRWGVINDAAVDEFCSELISEYDIRTPDARVKMRHLSGGNQQKAVLARELCRRPPLLIASQPTRGLDVGATETVLSRLQAERERDCAIVFFSTEIEEILLLSDRVAVMVNGKFLATLDRNEATYARLGLLMGGEAIEEEDEAMLEAVAR